MATLTAMAQVCKAWMDICAPELYNRVSVKTPRTESLIGTLSPPGSRLKQFGRRLTIHGPVPWSTLFRLLRSLPQVYVATIVDNLKEGQHTHHNIYNPRISRSCYLFLTATGSLQNLRDLTLRNQHFLSSVDLLQLLGSFPKLVRAHINLVTCQTTPVAAPRASSRLCELVASQVSVLWPLAFCWEWPHSPSSPSCESYPGLRHADALVLASILRYICLDGW